MTSTMPATRAVSAHSASTAAALAILAFILADLTHEALGHGVVAWLLGARTLVLSSTYLSSDLNSKLIQCAGTVANFLEGLLAWLLLSHRTFTAPARLFLILLLAFNLLDASGYLIFSALTNTGDWAGVLAGCQNLLPLRIAMGLLGAAAYLLSARISACMLVPFAERLEDLTVTPYWSVLLLNITAAALNPLGLRYVLLSALPATAGANVALLFLPRWTRRLYPGRQTVAVLPRSIPLQIAAAVFAILFIAILGRGITWNR